MSLIPRSGFALAEVLVGLVLTGLLGLVLVRSTFHIERVARAERAGAALQIAFDGGLGFLTSELIEAGHGSAGDDLLRIAPDSLSYRAVRGVGIACHVGASEILVALDRFDAVRLPQPGRDSLLLFTGMDSLGAANAGWTAVPLNGIGSAACGGRPALRLGTTIDTVANPPAALPPLPPVRVFEVMQARLYPSLGAWWLGARSESGGEPIQPLAGPFDSAGSPFSYFDSAGHSILTPSGVRSLRLRLSGRWSGWPGAGAARTDSAGQWLSPRNHAP